MPKVPENIRNSFLKVKDRFDGTLVLRNINGHFYVYRASSRWDKKEKRVRSNQEYLGRINAKGLFIEKSASYEEIELEKAKALIESHGGRIIFDEISQREQISNNQADVDEIDKKILMILSMNARATMPFIAKMTGLSTSAARYKVKSLERRFGIKYILEVDIEKLGYIPYLLLIKFQEDVPSTDMLREVFGKRPEIQFASITKGDYDVLIYILGEDPIKTWDNLWLIRTETALRKYRSLWYLIPFGQVYSFVPIREEFISKLLKRKDPVPYNKTSNQKDTKIKSRELIMLSELSKNSKENFSDIDKKQNLATNSARYTYQELKNKHILIRSTITLQKLPIKYIGVLLFQTFDAVESNKTRANVLSEAIKYGPVLNKYILLGNIGNPDGSMVFFPIIGYNDLERTQKIFENISGGTTIKNLIIISTLIGSLCYRRFDNRYSRQYELLLTYKKVGKTKENSYEI